MISTTTMTRVARVAMQGYLTASFFKEIVIDRTIQVVSKSEEVSISLVTSTVCSSTAVLLIASARAARQFLSDDVQRVPAPRDATAGLNAPFAGGKIVGAISTSKAFGAPARPSSSRAVIELTEPTFEAPAKGLSTTDSDTTLIAHDEELAEDTFCCDHVSDVESLADDGTFYEDDCQATAHCLTDDEPEHTLHVEYDSHTIDTLIRRMSAISLDDVPSHLSTPSLDNVPSHLSPLSLDDVSSHLSTISLDNVSSHSSTLSLDNVSSHLSTISLDNLPSHSSTLSLDDVPSHLSPLSLDNVPSHLSTLSLDDVPSLTVSTLSLGNVPSHFSLDDVPSQLSTLRRHHTLRDHAIDILPNPSQLRPTIHEHATANLPVILPLDNGSPQSSKCQPQRTLAHDHSIDGLIRRMAALSLDEVPSQLSKLPPHHALHDHAIDALPQKSGALTLDDNHAIDALPQQDLTLDDNHAIDALLQKLEVLTLDDDQAIDSLPDNTEAITLDDNHAINVLLRNPALTTLHDDTIDDLLQKMEVLTLDDNPHYSLSPRHSRRNASYTTTPPYSEISELLLMIVVLSPRNFNYDTPYTTMLSTPYFNMWNLLFSTIVPR